MKTALCVLANVYNVFIALFVKYLKACESGTVILDVDFFFSSVWSSVGLVWVVGGWLYRERNGENRHPYIIMHEN